MPSPTVTYTYSNGTTIEAGEVNQNFTDVINGITDGTKDLAVNSISCAISGANGKNVLQGGLVINDGSGGNGNDSLRAESGSNTHAIWLDAANEVLGIFNSSPQVSGGIDCGGSIRSTHATAPKIQAWDTGAGTDAELGATYVGTTSSTAFQIRAAGTAELIVYESGGIAVPNMKSGATQGAAGAAAGELWSTSAHATLPDNVVLIGV